MASRIWNMNVSFRKRSVSKKNFLRKKVNKEKMGNKKTLMIGIFLLFSVILIGLVSASFCCEKTEEGAWCQQEEDKDDCDSDFQFSQTGCESTTYCKLGTCVDSSGTCSPNSPQKNCNGLWLDQSISEIPQCEEACCVLGTESFLDTLGGCKKQAEIWGLETDFRKDITNGLECKVLSASNVNGACVFEKDLKTTCKFTTEKECFEMKKIEENVSFYRNTLCSSPKLNTICGPSEKTKCHDGKVYFVDNCGNLANIYDSERQGEAIYWTRIYDEDEITCDDDKGNKNSKTCGVCEDLVGTICGLKQSGDSKPEFGDYLCRDMDCKYNGKTYGHGDKWCAFESEGNKGADENLPGSEHYILECRDGEVLVQSCSEGDWRNKICVDNEIEGVPYAICMVNNWHDCTQQNSSKDCLNEDKRDCLWVEDEFGLSESQTNVLCVPKNAPGFDFWETESEASDRCGVASKTVKVTYKKGFPEFKWEPDNNKWALEDDWKNKMNNVCKAMGDCGSDVNYIGKEGWYEIDDLWSKE